MIFGIGAPTRPPLATVDNIVAIVDKAESLGFGYVSIPDHIAPPGEFNRAYPYTETGVMSWGPSGDVLEMLSLLSFVAARTKDLRIMTGIMVVPLRNGLFSAKALATIDVLSKGRLTVGCGVGWEHHEFAALGAPPFAERGRVTDEVIRLFKELWTQDQPRFEGQYVRFAGMPFLPKPVQKPHPPIWIGGESPAAMRRAARLGDAWFPIGSNQKYPLDTPRRLAKALESLRGYAVECERDPKDIGLAYFALWYAEQEARILDDGDRRAFTGTPQQIADDIKAFEDLGVECTILGLQANTLDATLARMERFADRVIPLTRR